MDGVLSGLYGKLGLTPGISSKNDLLQGFFLVAPGDGALDMSLFSMDFYLSCAQVKCVCLQNSCAVCHFLISWDDRKTTVKLNLPNSGGFLLNNGEGGRAGFRLEQPGIAPGTWRWEKSWCFLSEMRKDVDAGGRRK